MQTSDRSLWRRSHGPRNTGPRRLAFAASLALVFMIPWEGVVDAPGVGTGARLMGFLVGAIWIFSVLTSHRFRVPTTLHFVFYVFVGWNALSVFWTLDTGQTLTRIGTWLQLLIMVLIIWDLYTTGPAILAGLQAFVLGSYVAVGIAVSSFIAGDYYYSNLERYGAGDTNPDGFGVVLALGVPIAWYLATARSALVTRKIGAIVNYSYIPAAMLGIALSGTRTALIGLIPGMVFGLALLTRLRPRAQITVVLLFTTAVLALAPVVTDLPSFNRLGTTSSSISDADFNGRLEIWSDGISAFSDHPLVGVGANAYRSVSSIGKVAHNSFLSVLVELGAVGFALFAIIMGNAAIRAWTLPSWDRWFWLTNLLVWAIGAATLTLEHRKVTWLLLSLLVSTSALARRRSQPRYKARADIGHDNDL